MPRTWQSIRRPEFPASQPPNRQPNQKIRSSAEDFVSNDPRHSLAVESKVLLTNASTDIASNWRGGSEVPWIPLPLLRCRAPHTVVLSRSFRFDFNLGLLGGTLMLATRRAVRMASGQRFIHQRRGSSTPVEVTAHFVRAVEWTHFRPS